MALTFSVAIVNYNYGEYLAEAVDSALHQTDGQPQVVVVDDGSTDCSRDVLQSYEGRITMILTPNRGNAAAVNSAVAACTGDLVCFLDSDDLMMPNRLQRLREVYENHLDVQWVAHELLHVNRRTGEHLASAPVQIGFTEGRHDHQAAAQTGRSAITLPASSGMSWRRPFLERFTPAPEDMPWADNYLKFLTTAYGPGWVISDALALQGIHEHNIYSKLDGRQRDIVRCNNALAMIRGFGSYDRMSVVGDVLTGVTCTLSRGGFRLDKRRRRQLQGLIWRLPPRRQVGVLRAAAREAAIEARDWARSRVSVLKGSVR